MNKDVNYNTSDPRFQLNPIIWLAIIIIIIIIIIINLIIDLYSAVRS